MTLKTLTTGWTFRRALYLIFAVLVIIQAVSEHLWIGLLPGIWFAAMAVFNVGCAAGNCAGGNCRYEPDEKEIKHEKI